MRSTALAAAGLFALIGAEATAQATPKVVASILPVHSLVASVMEGVAEPELLMRGAASPHAYSLRPSDARRLAAADLIFWVGPALETALVKPMRALAGRAQVVALSEVGGIALLPVRADGIWEGHVHGEEEPHGHDAPHNHGQAEPHDHGNNAHVHGDEPDPLRVDPHLWLDPRNARGIVGAAVAFLGAADPANAARYMANGAATLGRLNALDAELEARLAPVRAIPFVVFHDAYQYFERRYRLAAVGAIALSPDRPPGARRLSEIRAGIVAAGAVCVFSEPQFAPALVATAIEGTPARAAVLDPLGAALPPGPDAYFAQMRGLADDLATCLGRAGSG